jgi:hypothetical protein
MTSETELVRDRFAHGDGSVLITILGAVGRAVETPPERLPPLYPAIDPDCVERLFSGRFAPADPDLSLTFPYAGVLVTVTGDGEVIVRRRDIPL